MLNASVRHVGDVEQTVDATEIDERAEICDVLEHALPYWLVVLVGDADALPYAHEVRFLLREDDRSFLVLEVFEKNLDFVAGLQVGEIFELFEWYRPFGFEADVEDDHVVTDIKHTGLHD